MILISFTFQVSLPREVRGVESKFFDSGIKEFIGTACWRDSQSFQNISHREIVFDSFDKLFVGIFSFHGILTYNGYGMRLPQNKIK